MFTVHYKRFRVSKPKIPILYCNSLCVYVSPELYVTPRELGWYADILAATVSLTLGVQVFVPKGVCNDFQVLEEDTEYLYFFDNEWVPGMEGVALTPLDSELNIAWPIPIDPTNRDQISEKDARAPRLQDLIN